MRHTMKTTLTGSHAQRCFYMYQEILRMIRTTGALSSSTCTCMSAAPELSLLKHHSDYMTYGDWGGLELQCLRASSWECFAFLNGDVILHGMDYVIRHGDYVRIQVEETRSRGSRNQLLPLTEDERKRKRDAQERQEHDRWPKQPVVAESLPRPSSSPMPRTDHAGYWICAAWVLMIAAGALMKMQCRKKRVTRRRTRRGVYQPTGLFGSDGTTM